MKSERTWFNFATKENGTAEISIYDEIGLFGITAEQFARDLKDLGAVNHIDLYINSPGGEVFQGFNIYNLLDRHKATITVYVDGLAASIASIIAMVGDEINIAENGMMMIHNPAGFVMGDSRDMRQIAAALDKMKESAITIYAKKTGKERDEIWDLMDAETWMSAEEAVELGFATTVSEPNEAVNLFDLSKFAHPPEMGTARETPPNRKAPTMTTPKETEDQMRERLTKEITATNDATIATAAAALAEKTKTAAAPKPEGKVETEAEMRTRITTEMDDHRLQVTNACEASGRLDLVQGFLNEKKTLPEVLTALAAAKKSGAKPPAAGKNDNEVSNRNVPQGQQGSGDPGVIDTSAIYAKWNKTAVRR